ncbi:hypothetical protein EDB85DRAFT_1899274 [Lactarius pseudohatsudake]|nr:hypothetical protein EDB85DRAFT_1899274 [Lactarius pseudohatsudake]
MPCPSEHRCNLNDRYHLAIYKHSIIAQAVATAGLQAVAPLWFPGVVQQLLAEIMGNLRWQLMIEVFPDLRQHGLPYLNSVDMVDSLNEPTLAYYHTQYGV